MKKSKLIWRLPALAVLCMGLVFPLAACGSGADNGGDSGDVSSVTPGDTGYEGGYDSDGADIDDITVSVPDEGSSSVTDKDKETGTADAAVLTGEVVSITEGGDYTLSGSHGGVEVSATDDVHLVLSGAEIVSGDASPIKVANGSGKVIITLVGENSVVDNSTTGKNAAIYSASADVTINGTGSLAVRTASNHGVQSKGTLIIAGGNITVDAADNGIAGNTALEIAGGTLDITAGGDAIKSKNGGVRITNAAVTAVSGGDGIDAETLIYANADLDLTTGGGSAGDSGITTSAAWKYETLDESDFESGKTYYTLSGSTYTEYESQTYQSGLYDRASCKGIKSNDITLAGGTIDLDCLDDGINADNVAAITGGTLTVSTACDGVQGDVGVLISAGVLDIHTIGAFVQNSDGNYTKSGNIYTRVDGDEVRGVTLYDYANSCKGVKSDGNIVISGGAVTIASGDKTLKSDGNIKISNGTLVLTTPDHGIHAEGTLHITDGSINLSGCYDGLKGGRTYIDGGTMFVTSNDDGVSGAGNDDENIDGYIEINGGNIYINAKGDGLDSNGNLVINGGIIIVNGPTDSGNGALDCGDGSFDIKVNGGILIAAGSSGMSESPSSASQAYSLVVGTSLNAGGYLTVSTNEGSLTFVSLKAAQSIVISSPLLKSGATVNVSTGGTLTGGALLLGDSNGNGLYSGGTLSAATSLASTTLSSKVTTVGSSAGGMGGSGFPGGTAPGGGRF